MEELERKSVIDYGPNSQHIRSVDDALNKNDVLREEVRNIGRA